MFVISVFWQFARCFLQEFLFLPSEVRWVLVTRLISSRTEVSLPEDRPPPARALCPTRHPVMPVHRPVMPARRPVMPARRPVMPARRPVMPVHHPVIMQSRVHVPSLPACVCLSLPIDAVSITTTVCLLQTFCVIARLLPPV